MARKILKYVLRGFLVLLALILLVPVLVYLPPVQRFVKDQGAAYVSKHMGLHPDIERLRLSFPLKLTVDRSLLTTGGGDTILYFDRLKANVALWPLLRKEVIVREFSFDGVVADYADTAGGFSLKARLGELRLKADTVNLKTHRAEIPSLELTDGVARLSVGPSRPDTAAQKPVLWRFSVGTVTLNRIDFGLTLAPDTAKLSVTLEQGKLNGCVVDLEDQDVSLERLVLQGGDYRFLTDTTTAVPKNETAIRDTLRQDTLSDKKPWTVTVARIELTDNSGEYGPLPVRSDTLRVRPSQTSASGTSGPPALPAFDPHHITVTNLNLRADSLYNRGNDLSLDLEHLSLTETSGPAIRKLAGRFRMDSTGYLLTGLNLLTESSSVTGDFRAGSGIVRMEPATPLNIRMNASINGGELLFFYAPPNPEIREILQKETLTAQAALSGRLDALNIGTLNLGLPEYVSFRANGNLRSPLEPHELSGFLKLEGNFNRLGDFLSLLPDTALRHRIAIPAHLHLQGTVRADRGDYAPVLSLTVRDQAPSGFHSPLLPPSGQASAAPSAQPGEAADSASERLSFFPTTSLDSVTGAPALGSDETDSAVRPTGPADAFVSRWRKRPDSFPVAAQRQAHILSSAAPVSVSSDSLAGNSALAALSEAVFGLDSLSGLPAPSEGTLEIRGHVNPHLKRYDIELQTLDFPLGAFLPRDSLGLLTLELTARGAGFDPLAHDTETEARLHAEKLEYRGYDYAGLGLEARLENDTLTGRLISDSEALHLDLALAGTLTPEKQEAEIRGAIDTLDLYRMHLTGRPLAFSGLVDAAASATEEKSYTLHTALDSIAILTGERRNTLRRTVVDARAGRDSVLVRLASGDLSLRFASPDGTDTLLARLKETADTLSRQLRERNLNMIPVQIALPSFRIDLAAGPDNILNNFLLMQGFRFRRMSLNAVSGPEQPLRLNLTANRFAAKGIVLDTLGAGIARQEHRLNYYVRMANSPTNTDQVGLLALYGNVVRDSAEINLWQRDRYGREGFRFGIAATLGDSSVTLRLFPDNPLLGFNRWSVNPNNFLTYRFDKRLYADIDLKREGQRFAVQSAILPDIRQGAVRVEAEGIDIDSTLVLLPTAPPVGGILNTDLLLGMAGKDIHVEGDVRVTDLQYDRKRIGTVDLDLLYLLTEGKQDAEVDLKLDGQRAIVARGTYRPSAPDSALSAVVNIPGIPLAAANPFLPSDMARLSGRLTGSVEAAGSTAHPLLNGSLQFDTTRVTVPLIGTGFDFSLEPIRVADSRILFNRYSIRPPNSQPLTINGNVNLSDFAAITTDLTVSATDFQAIDVARSAGSQVYGKAALDLNASVRGPVNDLSIRGNVEVLNSTDVTYVLRNSPLSVKNQQQNIVTFVSFRDSTEVWEHETEEEVRVNRLDLLVNATIEQGVEMTVNLSEDGNNRIDVEGGGNLTYTVNRLGDSRFAGRYTLSGGTVRYTPPLISEKIFNIDEGSYIEWTGDIADPTVNIIATETVNTTVTGEDKNSRQVNFDITVNIKNSLNDLAVTFDLSAPQDLTIQNQLSSLTAEQRSTQAMNLLIYNTYTGPGTTAKANTNNPLNNFIEKELNQWARNNLKGVDLSFGIDTYDQYTATGESARTDYSYQLSKNFFDDRIRVIVGGRYSTNADPNENLEENLIDDIALEYMLNRRHTMFLKVFRHTDYESILEGEITQTGFGFVMRRKLLRLGDLFRFRKYRQERRAEKEAFRRAAAGLPPDTLSAPTGQAPAEADRTGRETPPENGEIRPVPIIGSDAEERKLQPETDDAKNE